MKARTPSPHVVPQRVLDRVWDRVEILDWWDCWEWGGSIGSHGYGQIGWSVGPSKPKNTMTTTHRVTWLAVGGELGPGDTIDHLCRNRRCCNPLHLRVLSNAENARDNGQGRKTHCPAGHPYSEQNTYVYYHPDRAPSRRCRQCRRDRRHVLQQMKEAA